MICAGWCGHLHEAYFVPEHQMISELDLAVYPMCLHVKTKEHVVVECHADN